MKECPKCGKCLDDDCTKCPDDGFPLDVFLNGPRLIDKKYLLECCLGRGGMGAVYRAQHKELQKTFALKLIRHSVLQDPMYLARFKTEAKAMGKLHHPHIIQVTDYGIDTRNSGIPYLVMEYLEGTTLREHLKVKIFLTIEEAFPPLESIASAIDYAHSNGILHRDLNLKNIFLIRDLSGKPQVKILDFGLARIIGEYPQRKEKVITPKPKQSLKNSKEQAETKTLVLDLDRVVDSQEQEMSKLTQTGIVMGTPGYIAPEILKGLEATTSSDIYAFGILVYEVLVGSEPFKGSYEQIITQHVYENPPLPSKEQSAISEEFDQAILAPLQKDPNLRPKKAIDVIRQLKDAYAEYRYRVWRTKEIPKRIRMTGMLSIVFILLFLMFQNLPSFQSIENRLIDLRFLLLPNHPPDARILLVSIDEASLEADPTLLVEKADEMGVLLQGVMDAGARGAAIDFLLPERWNQSENFAKLILKNQKKLVLASYIKRDGSIMGFECIGGLTMAGLGSMERAQELFGFINMKSDIDGRMRRSYIGLQNQEGKWMYSMPSKSFQILTGEDLPEEKARKRLWIDYSFDWNKVQRISWKDIPSYLNQRPEFFHDKMVLVGGEYEGSQDFHRIPYRPGVDDDEISGLTIHALTINTLMEDKTIHGVSGISILVIMAVIFMFFSAVFLIRPKLFPSFILLFLFLIAYVLIAYFLFMWNRTLLQVGMPLITLILALVPVFWIRRKLTFIPKPSTEVKKQ